MQIGLIAWTVVLYNQAAAANIIFMLILLYGLPSGDPVCLLGRASFPFTYAEARFIVLIDV